MPAFPIAAILSFALPLPLNTMAPAWPLQQLGDVVRPVMEPTHRLAAALGGFLLYELGCFFLRRANDFPSSSIGSSTTL